MDNLLSAAATNAFTVNLFAQYSTIHPATFC